VGYAGGCIINEHVSGTKVRAWPKILKLFHEVLVGALLDGGIDVRPWDDDPTVRAVDYERPRPDFYERCIADGDNQEAKALQRAAKAARAPGWSAPGKSTRFSTSGLPQPRDNPTQRVTQLRITGHGTCPRDVPLCPGTGRDMGLVWPCPCPDVPSQDTRRV